MLDILPPDAPQEAPTQLLHVTSRKQWKVEEEVAVSVVIFGKKFFLLKTIDNSTPSKQYLHLISSLDHHQTSLLFRLCSGHISLNQHLFHICKAELPTCLLCQGITVESVKHFLLDCPHYRQEHHMLQRKLHQNVGSLLFLLSSPVTVLPLLKYVHSTGQFKMFFGKEKDNKIDTNSQHNGELQHTTEQLKSTISFTVPSSASGSLGGILRCLEHSLLSNACSYRVTEII